MTTKADIEIIHTTPYPHKRKQTQIQKILRILNSKLVEAFPLTSGEELSNAAVELASHLQKQYSSGKITQVTVVSEINKFREKHLKTKDDILNFQKDTRKIASKNLKKLEKSLNDGKISFEDFKLQIIEKYPTLYKLVEHYEPKFDPCIQSESESESNLE